MDSIKFWQQKGFQWKVLRFLDVSSPFVIFFVIFFPAKSCGKGWVNILLSSNLSLISDLNDLLNSFLNVICVPNPNPQQTCWSEIWIVAVGFRDVRVGVKYLYFFYSGRYFWNSQSIFLDFFFLPGISPNFPREIEPWGIFPQSPRWSFRWKNPRVSVAVCNGKTVVGGESEGAKNHIETHRVLWLTWLQICPLYIFRNEPPQMVPADLNIGETRVWRLDSGPNLQPCLSLSFGFLWIHVDIRYPSAPTSWWWSDMISPLQILRFSASDNTFQFSDTEKEVH